MNEDLSVVNFKEFHGTIDGMLPTASFCLANPFLKSRLAEYGVNQTSYMDYLKGTSFAKEMINVNFSYVTIDAADYIKGHSVHFKNETSVKSYQTFLES